MRDLHVTLFGKFSVSVDQDPLPSLDASGKVQQLFGYLLLHWDRPHTRDKLATLLWESSSTSQSKKSLRQALWQLQSALEGADCGAVLRVEPEWIQINPGLGFWLDVAVFEQVAVAVQGLPGSRLSPAQAAQLAEAARLYHGHLLEGWYQDWCLLERERLQHIYLDMVDKLMGYCEARNDYEDGVRYGQAILRYDRARERTHRRLMRLYYRAGNRSEALRQYARCENALAEELSVEPAHSTAALYAAIRDDRWPATAPTASPTPTLTPDLADRLRQLQQSLTQLQAQVDDCLRSCGDALGQLDRKPPRRSR